MVTTRSPDIGRLTLTLEKGDTVTVTVPEDGQAVFRLDDVVPGRIEVRCAYEWSPEATCRIGRRRSLDVWPPGGGLLTICYVDLKRGSRARIAFEAPKTWNIRRN